MTDKNVSSDDDVEFEGEKNRLKRWIFRVCSRPIDFRDVRNSRSYQSEHSSISLKFKSKDVYDRIRLVNWIRYGTQKGECEGYSQGYRKSNPPKERRVCCTVLKNDLVSCCDTIEDDEDWSSERRNKR